MSPPAGAFRFNTGRGGEHRAGYRGYLQAGGYVGYNALPVIPRPSFSRRAEARCWPKPRRKFTDVLKKTPSQIAAEAVVRIAQLFATERDIKGAAPDERRRVR